MRDLWKRIWYSEPVAFVGALVTSWLALTALDQANESWSIPLWIYIVMTLLVPFLTGMTRKQVTPLEVPEK